MKFVRDHAIPFAAEGAAWQVGAKKQTLVLAIRAIVLPYMGRDHCAAGHEHAEH